MSTFSHRVRFYGGRNTHALRLLNDGTESYAITACRYRIGPKDEIKSSDEIITCPACVRTINRLTTEETTA